MFLIVLNMCMEEEYLMPTSFGFLLFP
uniref:Uncharacterized protein n=1 Tax=Rhizophora mucronata TaxID=61149 RepID=A0A2P2N301_RHIMU